MEFCFANFNFEIADGRIYVKDFHGMRGNPATPFAEVQICGENKDTHLGVKMVNSSEGVRLKYVSHKCSGDLLEIIQKSELVEVKTTLVSFPDTSAVRIFTEVKNVSDSQIVLEEVSAFVGAFLGDNSIENSKNLHFYRFFQSHHAECQPRTQSFYDYGLHRGNIESQKRIAFANIGSWSTKEELPQGIIENKESKSFLMFQIESNNSWYYEIADKAGEYYLYLGGANLPFGGWCKALMPNESYCTPTVAIAVSDTLCGVIADMTKYRRKIAGKCGADATLPAIFNEYMHLSWDTPTAENTKKVAPIVAKTGVEYYVIDCGWHNEETDNVYPYVGQWRESRVRFPDGVRKTTDFIRSLGMKAGLWIEPEIVGIKCKEMLDYYDDSCFIQRNGRKIAVMGRYFLDYRNNKVREYMSETIRRMVEDYGADYIKFDYNEDCGVGTDYAAFSVGDGLEQCASAFYLWVKEMMEKYPSVVFEGCSSGGMRMDYKSLSLYPLVSTSDQVDYLKYPYIAGNILSAVIPEQAAVWSYPVVIGEIGAFIKPEHNTEWAKGAVSLERIAMNMINSFLGRMHLASHLEILSPEQLELIKDGVAVYNRISEMKKTALPYLPCGFTKFGDKHVVAGLKDENKIYLAVWALGNADLAPIEIKTETPIKSARVIYPTTLESKFTVNEKALTVYFTSENQARFFEIEI